MTDAATARSSLATLREADHDRYLAALYAPEERRPALVFLYAFNAEIAGVRDRVRQPLTGEMRLQWWRDVISSGEQAAGQGHPVASGLLEAIRGHGLPVSAFAAYLDARVFDLYDDPMPTRLDLEGYCGETAAALIQLAALVLDPAAARDHTEAAGHAGCAQAIAGLVRLLPLHRSRGQCYVPRDLLAAAGTHPEEFLGPANEAAKARAVAAMIALARDHLASFFDLAQALPASLRAAFLPLAPVPAYLDQVEGRELAALSLTQDISSLRRHWLMLRHATRGWPARFR